MEDKTGGPAFPKVEVSFPEKSKTITFSHYGMTLRDYFAAKIINGMVSFGARSCSIAATQSDKPDQYNPHVLAKGAYSIADAMLEARKK